MRQYKQIKGFTLVVISIIALLLSILMPSLSAAQDQAKRTTKQNMWKSKDLWRYNGWNDKGKHFCLRL